jgi:hypothetical protein
MQHPKVNKTTIFISPVFTSAAFEWFALQVPVGNVHLKGRCRGASLITEGAFVLVHMATYVFPQQFLRWIMLGAM